MSHLTQVSSLTIANSFRFKYRPFPEFLIFGKRSRAWLPKLTVVYVHNLVFYDVIFNVPSHLN